MTLQASFTFRFADVEVCEPELQVIRSGEPLAIEPKAFRVLIYLLRHAGHLVRKEELLAAVWGDTAVTDNSLTRAIALLRRLLDDDPHQPRYIETVSTAGYRFICPVESGLAEVGASSASAPVPSKAEEPLTQRHRLRETPWLALAAASVVLASAAGLTWYLNRPLPQLRVTRYTRLTNAPGQKLPIGTDGRNVFLNLWDPHGIATAPASGGQLTLIPIDLPSGKEYPNVATVLLAVSPDGSSLLVRGSGDVAAGWDMWLVAAQGHPAHYLARANDAAWSPDGKTVLYSNVHGDLYTIPSAGGDSHLLLASSAPSGWLLRVSSLQWSPRGDKIRFVRDGRYWEISLDGSNAHELLPGWHSADSKFQMCCGVWTPDQDFFLFSAGSPRLGSDLSTQTQIWALDERRGQSTQPVSNLAQLTTGPTLFDRPVISGDAKTIYARGVILRGELVIHNAKSKAFLPYLGGVSAEYVDYSRDGKYLIYVTYPEGIMWRANRDGTGLMQLTQPPIHPLVAKWSPDGTQILFGDVTASGLQAMYTISSQGGSPRRLIPTDTEGEGDPNWSPDGTRIVFSRTYAGFTQSPKPLTEILDLSTGKTSALPLCPEFFTSPRWSPDGRSIVGLAGANIEDLGVFDLSTQKWSLFHPRMGSLAWNTFSHDGRFVYFGVGYPSTRTTYSGEPGVYRIPITGGNPELVSDLTAFRFTGRFTSWMALDPDDNPLLLRDAGSDEIYALTLERK